MKKYNIIFWVIILLLCCFTQNIFANPENGVITAGQATIVEEGNRLNINQQTDKVIIDWREFNINSTEHTNFNQPSTNAIALNRVNSDHASCINGKLTANGKVIIINPNGVLFDKDSQVNLAGLIATSSNIDNQQFMQDNKLLFNQPGKNDVKIINKGQITVADGGLVGLLAQNVENNGVIIAKLGKVKLASGDSFTVDMYEDDLLKVVVSNELVLQMIANNGKIITDGGQVVLTTAAGENIVNSIIANRGVLQAQSVREKNGEIIIIAEGSNAVNNNIVANKGQRDGDSKVFIAGVLDVGSLKQDERGGKIKITGDKVAVLEYAFINASGHYGKIGTTLNKEKSAKRDGSAGGEILIGGDYLGREDFPTAKSLYIEPKAVILNDAIYEGDAGRTIFWSDDSTHFYGKVFARALGGKQFDASNGNAALGGNAGDGGFVEISGHEHLDAEGFVDLTASNGKIGTCFLDPTDVIIYGNVTPRSVSSIHAVENLAYNQHIFNVKSSSSIDNAKLDSILAMPFSGGLVVPFIEYRATTKSEVSNRNSIFFSRYLENLANSADLYLNAQNFILDLQGDTIKLPNDHSLFITANGTINSLSSGVISVNRTSSGGNINITNSGSSISDISNLTLNANNGGNINIITQGALILGNLNSDNFR